jgi:predicted HTH domain antitoxin
MAIASSGRRGAEKSKGGHEMRKEQKEQMVGTRLPEDLVRDLETIENAEQSDRATTVRKLLYKAIRDWKLEHYARMYGDGKLSLARAAKEADVSVWEMMDYASSRKVSAQYDVEDFNKDLKAIYSGYSGSSR